MSIDWKRPGVAICLTGLVAACSGGGKGSLSGPALPPTAEQLAHATYRGILEEPVTLSAGVSEGEPFVEGGASRPRVELLRAPYLTGDLTGDGVEEAVAFLSESSGGSGERIFLAVMKQEPGRTENMGTALVGDRVGLRSMTVEGGRVRLEVVQAGEGDAMCCPGELATREWALREGTLEEVGSEVTGRLSLAALAGPEWVLVAPKPDEASADAPRPTLRVEGDGSVSGFAGCNRFHGRFEESESPGSVGVGPLASTRMACPPEAMEIERVFLGRLGGVESYDFHLGQLALGYRAEEGGGLLLFDPAEMQPVEP